MDQIKSITARIEGIKYQPFLCRRLNVFNFDELDRAFSKEATFILKVSEKNQIALSWWVSAKRTRSYPYARVYDSLSFSGKKVTIIPVFKDEGKEGERDFLQWDTISLMSLLGVYVIIAYYEDAIKSSRYEKKITKQRFNTNYIKEQIKKVLSYQSDALHWNLAQVENIWEIGKKALDSYENISKKLNIEMHSKKSAEKRINELKKGKDVFMSFSRNLAEMAQRRESVTIQPKESLEGKKGTIIIKNYLGGSYYFTLDETRVNNRKIFLIEAKHTKNSKFPSLGDIKDGLLKMILFTNVIEVKIKNVKFSPIAVLKLTMDNSIIHNKPEEKIFTLLKKEAKTNNFKILLNKEFFP
jgi:hypothetical protein